jgi:hypothetical protein
MADLFVVSLAQIGSIDGSTDTFNLFCVILFWTFSGKRFGNSEESRTLNRRRSAGLRSGIFARPFQHQHTLYNDRDRHAFTGGTQINTANAGTTRTPSSRMPQRKRVARQKSIRCRRLASRSPLYRRQQSGLSTIISRHFHLACIFPGSPIYITYPIISRSLATSRYGGLGPLA